MLVGLLKERLSDMMETELADDLDEAADWVGTSDEERGATLRGLLRLSDAIVRSRDALSPSRSEPYPHIDSEQRGVAHALEQRSLLPDTWARRDEPPAR